MHTYSFVFYFTKNFYLVSEFDDLITTLDSAGLIDHIMSKYFDFNLMNSIEKQPPSSLTYNNVAGFFELFYYGCALSIVSFMCETIFSYIKERKGRRRYIRKSNI